MIYSDADIRKALASGEIVIEEVRDDDIQPASVDLRLSNRPFKFMRELRAPIDPMRDQSGQMVDVPFSDGGSGVVHLHPGEFALASTRERVVIGNTVAGRLEGKSSLARLGLIVHTTAGFFDPGFEGFPTLELLNVSPRSIILRPGMAIAQMAFFEMRTECERPYSLRGKYAGQGADPAPSQYFKNEMVGVHPEPVPRVQHSFTCEFCGHGVGFRMDFHLGDPNGWTHVDGNTPPLAIGESIGRSCGDGNTTAWPAGMALP